MAVLCLIYIYYSTVHYAISQVQHIIRQQKEENEGNMHYILFFFSFISEIYRRSILYYEHGPKGLLLINRR